MREEPKSEVRSRSAAGPSALGPDTVAKLPRRRTPLAHSVFLALFLPLFPAVAQSGDEKAQAGSGQAQAVIGQEQSTNPMSPFPDAPKPQNLIHQKSRVGPCRVVSDSEAAGTATSDMAGGAGTTLAGVQPTQTTGDSAQPGAASELPPCPLSPINWLARFINGPAVKPLTPKEKARLAMRNVLDPFNAITILGQSGIAVGSDAHSPYGPGMAGFGRSVGVSYAQDLTGEFFGTFLIPSVVHQDPHYHRLPDAPMIQRVRHAIVQVVWTQGDNGKGMLNYANLLGFAIDDEISNLYVPGRATNLPSSAARYSIGLATAPIDNFITEFLPTWPAASTSASSWSSASSTRSPRPRTPHPSDRQIIP